MLDKSRAKGPQDSPRKAPTKPYEEVSEGPTRRPLLKANELRSEDRTNNIDVTSAAQERRNTKEDRRNAKRRPHMSKKGEWGRQARPDQP